MTRKKSLADILLFIFLAVLAAGFIFPIFVVFINSFKTKFSITSSPFSLPNFSNFAGIENYITGIADTDFWSALGYSLFITFFSVLLIALCTSMTAWYLVRVKNKFTHFLYIAFVSSMIIPFQMVMFTMSKISNILSLDNPLGIVFIYLGFGAGLSVFMFSGFIKSIPKSIEEAAVIDGCTPLKTFFKVVFPVLKPTAITVSILNAMWIWNDYLLPYLVIGSDYKTIPIAVQYLKGGYGSVDMGSITAVLVLAVIPVIVFYVFSQKHIISGVASGAVKG